MESNKKMKIPSINDISDSINTILPDIIFRYDKRLQLFLEQPLQKQIEILHKVPISVRRDLMHKMPSEVLIAIL